MMLLVCRVWFSLEDLHLEFLLSLSVEEISETYIQDVDQVPIKLLKRKSSPTSSNTDLALHKKNLVTASRKKVFLEC
ncbi:unnamed protein product [Malus baccata var. baccata]